MKQQPAYSLPAQPPAGADTLTIHFLNQFMHEFQSQRGKDTYLRIYTAISQTATKSGNAPEVVARALVESGLRASRESFPGKFVETIEKKHMTPKWEIASVTPQQRELLEFWGVSPRPANGYTQARRGR